MRFYFLQLLFEFGIEDERYLFVYRRSLPDCLPVFEEKNKKKFHCFLTCSKQTTELQLVAKIFMKFARNNQSTSTSSYFKT